MYSDVAVERDEAEAESGPKGPGQEEYRYRIVLDGDREEAATALAFVPADDYSVWIRMGLALKNSFGADGFDIWLEWSQKSESKYPGAETCREVWDGLLPSGAIGIGSVFFEAKSHGWNGPSVPVIREMNEKYGVLTHGNKTIIIIKNGDHGPDDDFVWLSKPAFLDRLAGEKTAVINSSGDSKTESKAKYWLKHSLASHYHRTVFDPERPPGHNGLDWNLWRGFGVVPIPGEWDLLKLHVLENICQSDAQLYAWLLNWMALGVQQPGLVIGTAPVLLGAPGTGKGFVAHAYGRLWGAHYVSVTAREHVSGRFNAHLVAKRFVFIDEGIFGGDRREAGIIKGRVTEPTIMVELKGVDPMKMRNAAIYMVASNEASVVPADIADRRWQVFNVGSKRREDHRYFTAIQEQLDDGGYEAMLHELLERDFSEGPDPRRTIKTEALFEQILLSQGPMFAYLHHLIDEGVLPQPDAPGNRPGVTTIAALYADLHHHHRDARYVRVDSLGRFLQKVVPGIRTVQSGTYVVKVDHQGNVVETSRSTRYVFPRLAEVRRDFERYIGQSVPWSNDLEDWLEDTVM